MDEISSRLLYTRFIYFSTTFENAEILNMSKPQVELEISEMGVAILFLTIFYRSGLHIPLAPQSPPPGPLVQLQFVKEGALLTFYFWLHP